VSAPAPAQGDRDQTQVIPQQSRAAAMAAEREPADPDRGGRAVRILGPILGFAALIWLWRHGIRIHLPVSPSYMSTFFGFLLELGITAGLGILTAHLVRVHHRRALRYAAAQTRSGAIAGARAAGRHSRHMQQWAGRHWQDRRGQRDEQPAGPQEPQPSPANPGGQSGLPDSPNEGGTQVPAPSRVDVPIHHYDDRNGRSDDHSVTQCSPARCERQPVAAPGANVTGSRPVRRNRHDASRLVPAPSSLSDRQIPAGWNVVVTDATDFEADDEDELLDMMGGQTAGMLSYGEAIAAVYENHVHGDARLDPAAMEALHDVAEAIADAADVMAQAIDKFRQVYEAPRQFVADEGVLPKDGDFLTGND
jgi:hypothetical protein